MKNDKLMKMKFSDIYLAYQNKIIRKKQNIEYLDEIIIWLFGYSSAEITNFKSGDMTVLAFIENIPKLNDNVNLITGRICGIKVEEIEDDRMKKIRYLDKLVDEINNGKDINKVKRMNQ